ncbi:MAG TPA: MdtA/MuxA family multidrug efflux RND transporter periplasmic adaptor subunit [Vicinamibacterales bacterium]
MTTPDTATSSPSHAPSKARHWILGFVLLLLGAAAVWYWGGEAAPPPQARNRFFGPRGPNFATPVRAAEVRKENIEVQIRALGTVTPLNTVTVRSRLDGELVRVLFSEGQMVREGQLLAEIDPRPYQVALAQAEGQMQENEARLKNAEGDLERYRKLLAEGLITAQQVTTQEALVQQYRGALQANQAQVNNARLQLSYTRIVAPISGRLGLRQVDPGNLIRSSDPNGLVVITQVKPISVIFTVPEADLQAVLNGLRQEREMPVEAWDRGDSQKLADGLLRTIDNQIDTTTGTIKLRATFANADEQLFPNQFVNVRLRVRTIRDTTVIPSAAVQRASFGTFVYVIKPEDSTVTIRRITLGPAQDTRVSVTEGLEPGELIVLEGVDDLTEGARIEIIPDGAPGRAPQPAAAESTPPAEGGSRPAGRRP